MNQLSLQRIIVQVRCVFLVFLFLDPWRSYFNIAERSRIVLAAHVLGDEELVFPSNQFQALSDLYYSTNGLDWRWKDGSFGNRWNFSDPDANPCSDNWQGINCTSTSTEFGVAQLNLHEYNLQGFIPDSIVNLQNLTNLELSNNNLTMIIPDSLYSIKSLLTLDLSYNNLKGSLSENIGNLVSLITLRLIYNSFSSSLPDSIGNLQSLEELFLSYNNFSSSLPNSLFTLSSSLHTLQIANNRFSEKLSDRFRSLSSLTYLSAYNNLFYGSLTENMFPVLLTNLDFSNNSLTGILPKTLGNLSYLSMLRLSDNSFHGTIPSTFFDNTEFPFHSLENINLANNFFHTSKEEEEDLSHLFDVLSPHLKGLALSHNAFTGPLPLIPSIIEFTMRDNYFQDSFPSIYSNSTLLLAFDISDNYLTGSVIFDRSAPEYFNISWNFFSGNLNSIFPETTINNSSSISIFVIAVNHNEFTGKLPTFTRFPSLTALIVGDNKLTGTLPKVYHSNLKFFAASTNCFHGTIPEELCSSRSKSELGFLILNGLSSATSCQQRIFPETWHSWNAFTLKQQLTGTIPSCLYQLPMLKKLHLSGNGLTGSLPSSLSLVEQETNPEEEREQFWISSSLNELILSHNFMTGTIPIEFQKKEWISFDLSYNEFTGTLSSNFNISRHSSNSQTIALVNNHLSGFIPSDLLSLENINILDGNLFACDYQSDRLPQHDPNVENYSCGSDIVNLAVYTWLIAFSLILLLLLIGSIFACSLRKQRSKMMKTEINGTQGKRNRLISYCSCCLVAGHDFLVFLYQLGIWFEFFHSFCESEYLKVFIEWKYSHPLAHPDENDFPTELDQTTTENPPPPPATNESNLPPSPSPSTKKKATTPAEINTWKEHDDHAENTQLIRHNRQQILILWIFNQRIRQISFLLTCFILIFLLPTYSGLSTKFSLYSNSYAWSISALFLSGETSGILLSLELFGFLCFAWFIVSIIWIWKDPSKDGEFFLTDEEILNRNNSDNNPLNNTEKMKRESSSEKIILFLVIGIMNAIVMLLSDVLYVFVITNYDTLIITFAEIGLALLKIFWNNFLLWNSLAYFKQRKSKTMNNSNNNKKKIDNDNNLNYSSDEIFFLSFNFNLNNLIYPILAIFFISSNCFYHVFTPSEEVTSSFQSIISTGIATTNVTTSSSYIPPFTYSYQCSSEIFAYYCPVYVLMFIFESILIPGMRLFVFGFLLKDRDHENLQENNDENPQQVHRKEQKNTENDLIRDEEDVKDQEITQDDEVHGENEEEEEEEDDEEAFTRVELISHGDELEGEDGVIRPSDQSLVESLLFTNAAKGNKIHESHHHQRQSSRKKSKSSFWWSGAASFSWNSSPSQSTQKKKRTKSKASPSPSNRSYSSVLFSWKSFSIQSNWFQKLSRRYSTNYFTSSYSLSHLDKEGNIKKKRRIFDKHHYTVRFNTHFLILLAYGVVFPPLAVIGCLAIMFRSFYEEVIIGKYLHELTFLVPPPLNTKTADPLPSNAAGGERSDPSSVISSSASTVVVQDRSFHHHNPSPQSATLPSPPSKTPSIADESISLSHSYSLSSRLHSQKISVSGRSAGLFSSWRGGRSVGRIASSSGGGGGIGRGLLFLPSEEPRILQITEKYQFDCAGMLQSIHSSFVNVVPISILLFSYLIFDTFGRRTAWYYSIIPAIFFIFLAIGIIRFPKMPGTARWIEGWRSDERVDGSHTKTRGSNKRHSYFSYGGIDDFSDDQLMNFIGVN